MTGETRAAAHGRWREILRALGVDPKFLVNRHGPCPFCGGRDRYRFDDRDGDGGYYCHQCRPGNGIGFVRKFLGCDAGTAFREIDRVLGILPRHAPRPAATPTATDRETRLVKLNHILDGATDPMIVADYLTGRGLNVVSPVLLGHQALPYYDDDLKFRGRHPAIVAPVLGPDGALQSIHRTYLADVAKRKKLAAKADSIKGAAVRLFEPTDQLGVAEGIETAIAAHELFSVPVWSVINDGNMEVWRPPTSVRVMHIFGDNDKSFAGQKAAYTLANALAVDQKREIEVQVHIPPGEGGDWLDVLNARRAT